MECHSPSKAGDRARRGPYIAILLVCCGMMASSVGLCANSYGVFYTPVSAALGVGRGSVVMHATISGIVTGIGSPIAVKLLKKIDVRTMLCVGTIMSSASFALNAYATEIWMFNLLGVVRGIGNCSMCIPVITMLLGNWFKKGLGTIVGFTMSFSGISGALLSPGLAAVISAYGYRTGYMACAAIVALLTLPAALLFLKLTPEQAGLFPYGDGPVDGDTAPSAPRLVHRLSFSAPLYTALAVMSGLAVTVTGFTTHLSGMAENAGATAAVGATLVSAAMVGNIFYKFTAGVLCDRIGVFKAGTAVMAVSISGMALLLSGGGSMLTLTAGVGLYSAIYAVGPVILPTVIRHIYGDGQYGEGYAVIAALMSICPSLTMTAIGYAYDFTGGYAVSIAAGMALVICSLLLWQVVGRMSKKGCDMPDTAGI